MEEMCQPQILLDRDSWTGAMGLGFFLIRSRTGRTWVGHTGGMPGHITGVFTDRESGTGGIVLMSSTAPDAAGFAIELADHVVDHDPADDEPWRPGTAVPDELRGSSACGSRRVSPFVFSVRAGTARGPRARRAEAQAAVALRAARADDVYRDRRRPRGGRAAPGHPRRRRQCRPS